MPSSRIFRVRPIARAIIAGASLCGASSAYAQSGQFTYVIGDVSVQSPGATVPARVGTEVNPNDIIITGPNGMAQLTMVDNARLSLRSNSKLLVSTYPRSRQDPPGAVLNLLQGTMRAFTTLLTKENRDKYSMRTRVATVGIRGSGNILNQSEDDTTTTNHTIEGSHEVAALDGNFPPIITNPNQTVQVVMGQAPKIIPTPPSLLDAGKTMVGKSGSTQVVDDDPTKIQQNSVPTTGGTVVGGNGLGFTLVDATSNVTSDPINLQSVVIGANGTTFSEQAVPGQMGLDAGALRSYTAYAGTQSGTSLNITGGSATELQTITVGEATTIVLGRWTGVNSAVFSGGGLATGAGGIHWGYGGAGFPTYLSDVLTGSASYTRAGATTPTNQFGTLGQLVSTVLDVNFTARTLNATIGISMPSTATVLGGTWTMQAANVPFSLNSFIAFSGGGGLTVTNGSGQNSNTHNTLSGTLEGSFIGATLNGAIVGYGLVDQTKPPQTSGGSDNQTPTTSIGGFQSISGVVAFQGPSQNAAAAYRDGVVSDANGVLGGASYIRSFVTTNRPGEVTVGAQGAVSAFTAPYVAGNRLVGHLAYAQGSSTNVDNGFDATTGLVWGRWSGGTATIGGQTGVSLASSSQHYIFGPAQAGPVSLPLTGTAVYDVVGSTRPTDGAGRTGTFNSATLAANFSARTVDATVNIGINNQTWTGAANGMPIYRDQYFSAYGGASIAGVPRPSQLVITCTPSCTPTIPTGSLDGFFTGRTGSGAGVMYNLGGNAGAVAFARRAR